MALSEQEEFELLSLEREKSRGAGAIAPSPEKGRPLPANAGVAKFLTGLAGLPVDTVENVANLGLAGVGTALTAAGRPDMAPSLLRGSAGGSEHLQGLLRRTGQPGLSPDNPTPESALGTAQYNLVARGGAVPGGFLPAAASMAAEKVAGPEWAAVGGMVPAAVGQATRSLMATKPNANTALLDKEGVSLTPGQIKGGMAKSLEDKATSIPLLGDAINSARRRGVESFDAAAINRALAPFGEKLPSGLKGNDAIKYAYGKLGEKYDDLLPSLKGDLNFKNAPNALPAQAGQAAPASLREELNAIRQMGANLPNPQRGMLGRIIDNEVIKRFTPQGKASGESLKEIESKLGVLERSFRKSENYDVRTMGGAVQEVQNALRRMIERVNPQYGDQLATINEGYANFKVAQKAASSPAAVEGVFSPTQLHSAVRAKDPSKDKARFAEGGARMQDLSTAGKAVLPSSVPDSGTVGRAALAYAMAHPLKAAGLGIPIAAAALPYTPIGQSVLQRILMGQGEQKLPNTLAAQIALIAEQESQR